MEKLIPRPEDFAPVMKSAAELVKQITAMSEHLGDAIKTVNTALYLQGFLTGMTVCATILTAIWAFSRNKS